MAKQLTDLGIGEQARIVEIAGGQSLHGRLASMGLRRDVRLKVISTPIIRRGPVVISVAGAQVAIGHGMAAKISVELLN